VLHGSYRSVVVLLLGITLGVVTDRSIAADDGELAYMQVADDIAARIKSGELAPGTRLRSERDLAEIYGRAYGTIRKAMQVLRDRGLIETIHGRGTFVAKGEKT
jgi:GntR family transcriptional regulator